LGFFLEGGAQWTPVRSRYVAQRGVLLAPSRLSLVVVLGLSWDTAG
jgi:hypothetical protein